MIAGGNALGNAPGGSHPSRFVPTLKGSHQPVSRPLGDPFRVKNRRDDREPGALPRRCPRLGYDIPFRDARLPNCSLHGSTP